MPQAAQPHRHPQQMEAAGWHPPCQDGHWSSLVNSKNVAAEGPEPGAEQGSELVLCDKPGQRGVLQG